MSMTAANVLVGFASAFQDEPGPLANGRRKMIPVYVFPGCETVFVTMAIDLAFLQDAGDRSGLADFIADAVADKVKQLILDGPGTAIVG